MLPRRALLILPAALGGCGGSPPPRVEGPPISYAYLTQIRLDVSAIETEDRNPSPGPNDLGRTLQPTAAEAVLIMGRDRLAAFGTENRARFAVTRAQILRARDSGRVGVFAADPGEQLTCQLTARLEILGENDRRLGFAEAQAQRSQTAGSTPNERRIAAESLLRQTMFDLNTEFEFQIRRALRPYLVEGTGAPPPPVGREAL
ncbi:hypothetical protein EJV46_12285 [Roseococcus sp. SYP-B2431]|uniref:hypothetical protein n=1 Tax=Roseococcus sp. SYP-B2431 TaxID=2496640 RepID=UPI00103E9C7B|nr:hypothetical protein [Roseococcus sp. SYP-B2431]TCH97985.1 hypothetical protein EJV46_12285 [Roseococcus sp. SYP-B2431]